MKRIGFWLLVLIAVLVPATAALATSIAFPAGAADRAHGQGLAVQAERVEPHAAAPGSHARVAKAKMASPKAGVDDDPAEHCHDASACGHCASCGSCASIAAATDSGAAARPLAMPDLCGPGSPPSEFLQSGQERPPRTR